MAKHLSQRGVLLVADLIRPQRIEAQRMFADAYDRIAEAQSLSQNGSTQLYERLVEEEWNYFRFPDPDDKPSALFDQLTWLKEAGFEVVDCFWLQAGHAIFGAYKSRAPSKSSV